MHVYLASDHAGFQLKNTLVEFLKGKNYEVTDMGPELLNPQDDYPDLVMPLARTVAGEPDARGIVIGMSGQGEAMAANRVVGARAALYYGGNPEVLTLSREHNNANILSLGSHFLSAEEAGEAVERWLSAGFSGEGRHLRRIAKLDGGH